MGAIIRSFLKIRKVKHREVKELTQCLKIRSVTTMNLCISTSELIFLMSSLCCLLTELIREGSAHNIICIFNMSILYVSILIAHNSAAIQVLSKYFQQIHVLFRPKRKLGHYYNYSFQN